MTPTWRQRIQLATFGLCNTCWPKWSEWSNYREPIPFRITNGASYDDTTAGAADRQHACFERWTDTVHTQQQLIADTCARLHARRVITIHLPNDSALEAAA